jgi:hypothetical protein
VLPGFHCIENFYFNQKIPAYRFWGRLLKNKDIHVETASIHIMKGLTAYLLIKARKHKTYQYCSKNSG